MLLLQPVKSIATEVARTTARRVHAPELLARSASAAIAHATVGVDANERRK